MRFDYDKEYTVEELFKTFELPLYVRKGSWTSDFCFKILSVGDWLYGETYKGGALYQSNKKYRKSDVFYVCENPMPKFIVAESNVIHEKDENSLNAVNNEYLVDDEQVYEEENANLDRIEDKIDVLYDKQWKRYLEYKEEIDTFVVYDWEDRNRLLDIREIAEPCKQSAEEYLSFKPSPYFMRVDVDINDQDIKTYFIGKKGLTEGVNTIIYDWYNPVAYEARFTQNKKFKVKNNNCTLYLRRQIDIQNQQIVYINTEFDSDVVLLEGKVIDPFLLSVLRDKRRDYKLTDIIRTIQLNQSEIISKPIEENFIVQGCAGSGKTMILLHRLSYLLHNYENYGIERYCILTPNEFFNLHINDLSKDLGIDKISRFTVEQYYEELIKRLTADDWNSKLIGGKVEKEAKIKLPTDRLISEKILDERFLSEIYSDEYQSEMMMLYNGLWSDFKKTFEVKDFSRLICVAEKDIPNVSTYNFEVYRNLKSYYAGLIAIVTETETKLKSAQENVEKSLNALMNYKKQLDEANTLLPILENDIAEKINNCLTSYEHEGEKLKQTEVDIVEEIQKLESQKNIISTELGNAFTVHESNMTDNELVSWTYIVDSETAFARHIKTLCEQDIADVKQLQLDYKKTPFYNFGKKGAINKQIELRVQQYQSKALELLNEYRFAFGSKVLSLRSNLQQVEESLLESNKQREEIKNQLKQNTSNLARAKSAKIILAEEKRLGSLEPLLNDTALDFVKEELKRLVLTLKTINSSQSGIVSQNEILEKNQNIIDNCQKLNIDEAFKQELSNFLASLEPIDMKNIYHVFEERLKETYSKHNQKYKRNDNYRHKLYILLMLCGFYYGSPRKVEKFINIDEAQDLAISEYRVLRNVLGKETVFNLYGDVNQLVYSYKGVTDWEDLNDMFSSKLYFLNENYRNTIQITEYCNNEFGAEVVAIGLKGEEVKHLSLNDATIDIQKHHKLNPKSRMAIIYKKGKEQIAQDVANSLQADEYALDVVDNSKISIITVEMSKGLEFERVAVITEDMTINEKYISYTRALEGLVVT